MMSSGNKMVVPICDNLKIVVERNENPGYEDEIYIGIMKDDDVWYQDIAVVRGAEKSGNNDCRLLRDDAVEMLVYADENDEDYTDKFVIPIYKGGI